jgi:large subunit ribosomal protein L15
MQIHELKSIRKKAQRVGRGGKRGSYSGRGVKGQKSRAGHRIRPAERDVILRIPKRRGFANLPTREKSAVFNVGDLSRELRSFATGNAPVTLNPELLKAAGLLAKDFKGKIKLLGDGEMTFPAIVEKLEVSRAAEEKIRKAGGRVVTAESASRN